MASRAAVHGGWRLSWPRGWTGAALACAAAGAIAAGIVPASRERRPAG